MATWIIGGAVLAALVFAGFHSVKSLRKGDCGYGCDGCSGCGVEHKQQALTPPPPEGGGKTSIGCP